MKDRELERHFGKTVRSRRREKNITQEQLAETVGISTTYLRNVERGNHSITWKIWLNLCKVLQIDIKDFLDMV